MAKTTTKDDKDIKSNPADRLKLSDVRDALRDVEELLTDVRAAVEEDDADKAKEMLDDFFEDSDDD